VHDVQQPPHFWALNDVIRYTTEELLNITTSYATNEEAACLLSIPGDREAVPTISQAAPSGIAIQCAKKDAKGGKERRKRHLSGLQS
jgi:hypothetical protein